MTEIAVALITSAAYVNAELSAEFGQLPPCLLPFGHDRLFVPQLQSLKRDGQRLALTLPASFILPKWEHEYLQHENVEIIYVPDDLSLGESIAYALTIIDARGAVRILHGDTLFLDPLPDTLDEISVATATDAYAWGTLATTGKATFVYRRPNLTSREQVLTGWFSFSSGPALTRALARARGDFFSALDIYSEENPLSFRQIGDWLDFGHLQTFYHARLKASTARAFNSLSVSRRSVLKTGEKIDKIDAEAEWFEKVPPVMRQFMPPFLGREQDGYRIGYQFSPTLHELFVFGALEPPSWRQIMEGVYDFMGAALAHGVTGALTAVPDNPLQILVFDKTAKRLEQWAEADGIDLEAEWTTGRRRIPSLRRIAEDTAALAAGSAPLAGVMHGDLCFTNTFYDFREQQIKVIDPRGSMIDGKHSIYGDLRYDLAKLNHSIEGYDQILAGRYHLEDDGSNNITLHLNNEGAELFIRDIASDFDIRGQRTSDASTLALTIHLFLSMLPLHADRPDRQRAFLANALRLYAELEKRA
ncbi:hypothetical protein [Xanthobacter sediminis]